MGLFDVVVEERPSFRNPSQRNRWLAGRYRAQLLLQSASRTALAQVLGGAVPKFGELPAARKVRLSVDVDPIDGVGAAMGNRNPLPNSRRADGFAFPDGGHDARRRRLLEPE